ncbi:MAG: hypothetical protein ACXVGB_00335 [Mycobacteriaceae bacterium]
MAIANKSMSVTGDAAAALIYSNARVCYPSDGSATNDVTVFVDNAGGNTVYIGATAATTDGTNGAGAAAGNKGFPVATATQRTFVLKPGESIYVFAHTTNVITAWANGQ